MRRVLAIAVAALAVLPGCSLVGGGGGGGTEITAYFPKAVALYDQSQVRVLGLPAGSVTDIETEDDRVRVDMRIDDGVPIPADVQAAIIPNSLIGERRTGAQLTVSTTSPIPICDGLRRCWMRSAASSTLV